MDKKGSYQVGFGNTPEGARLISGVRMKFRDEFGWGMAELADRYDTSGSTVQPLIATDRAILNTGTTPNAVCQMLLPVQFAAPAQIVISAQFGQANPANCDVSFELIDSAGQVCVAFLFPGGSTAAQCRALSFNKNRFPAWENTGTWYAISDRVAAGRQYIMQLYPDEVRFAQRDTNSAAGRNTFAVRTMRIPDPDEQLMLRIRAVNGPTAPASATELRVFSINITDINEMPVDLTNTGGGSLSESIPISLVSAVSAVSAIPRPDSGAGGYTTFSRAITAATTNPTITKNSATNLGGGVINNTSAADVYLKIYNKAAVPTVGTDQPIMTVRVKANDCLSLDDYVPASGIRLPSGLAWAMTAAAPHTDTTAVAAGIIVELFYV
ncbi:hypothetical protein [Chitinibacter tainanensis]|uniref:hypothetical protein n=1 Tax=Chitinibacter tainanensis TaxID=230667 RepID=UPI0004032410|nr:hypothetical protein [Chitinibacter tainanensis]